VRTSLRLSTSWVLPSWQWHEFDAVLDRLSVALSDGDSEAFGRVCADLIDLAPKRVTPLGDEPVIPAPETVRERINEMVHRLVDAPTTRRPADSQTGSAGAIPPNGNRQP
jgi:hypothetical protein